MQLRKHSLMGFAEVTAFSVLYKIQYSDFKLAKSH